MTWSDNSQCKECTKDNHNKCQEIEGVTLNCWCCR